ncbi:MAG: hypothetical protein P9L94_02855 [Candidatus Hinthialibacter antarcticus]|nr:hypothetical protein [Candidatus Hinthialibacter antarcticus]
MKRCIFLFIGICLFSAVIQAQTIEELVPEDAGILKDLIGSSQDTIFKLAPGVYDMGVQLRFNANTNLIIEGSGSGMGADATVLDFMTYSNDPAGDGRALSIRGGVVFRNLTIINVIDRATDLRTGDVSSPSNQEVIFENVWFINCSTALKSTGGRTVGSAETPMQIKHCVFALTADYPFVSSNDAVDVRDTTYIELDHCDFFSHPNLVQIQVDDPDAAPNIGPQISITNSIFLATDGEENNDFDIVAGNLTIRNSVLWDAGSNGEVQIAEGGVVDIQASINADPIFVNATIETLAVDLDFNLQPNSPAMGLGADGLNAGSVASEPVAVEDWELN